MTPARLVIPFRDVDLGALPEVGGKNASLGELLRELAPEGMPRARRLRGHRRGVPRAPRAGRARPRPSTPRSTGWTCATWRRWHASARSIRAQVAAPPLPADDARTSSWPPTEQLSRAIRARRETDVAVRSSATAEDLPTASFAGQQETYLNVRGDERAAARRCATAWRRCSPIGRSSTAPSAASSTRQVALSVGVQKMVRSDLGAAGVIFTLDTESGFRDVVTRHRGLGARRNGGPGPGQPRRVLGVTSRRSSRASRRSCAASRGDKAVELVYGDGDGQTVPERRSSEAERTRARPERRRGADSSRAGRSRIEQHYSAARRAPRADGHRVGQGRTERTALHRPGAARDGALAQADRPSSSSSELRRQGRGARARQERRRRASAAARVRVIRSRASCSSFRDGEVLVAPMTDPDWEPVLKRAAAVVTDQGGRTCHAAIVSRELGMPCVVGTGDATRACSTAASWSPCPAPRATRASVYAGKLAVRARGDRSGRAAQAARAGDAQRRQPRERLSAWRSCPAPASACARIEFIVSSWIGVHPMALVHPERVDDRRARAEIRADAPGYADTRRVLRRSPGLRRRADRRGLLPAPT